MPGQRPHFNISTISTFSSDWSSARTETFIEIREGSDPGPSGPTRDWQLSPSGKSGLCRQTLTDVEAMQEVQVPVLRTWVFGLRSFL